MDLSQPDSICAVIREVQPHLIVNAAAYTAVDKAETESELAMAVNGIAPGVVAEEAKRCGASVVHYSTDYVFDGEQQVPYTETDLPNPQGVYGKTKLAGEVAIATVKIPYLILRTSWVYGLRGKNFLLTMLRLAQEREELKVVEDQIGAPTWSRTIAETTSQILESSNLQILDPGIYHLTSTGQTSWYGFAKAIFELTQTTVERKLKTLVPISSDQYPSSVKRPHYSSLNVQKVSQTFDVTLSDWETALKIALGEGAIC